MSILHVTINGHQITNGQYIQFDQSQINPKIQFVRGKTDNYVIIMVDPDAPSRDNPIYKYYLHMIIINNSTQIVKYQKPSPPPGSGNHRYKFYLLKQSNELDKNILRDLIGSDKKIKRENFDLNKFIIDNKLKVVDTVFFETSR